MLFLAGYLFFVCTACAFFFGTKLSRELGQEKEKQVLQSLKTHGNP